MLNCVWLKTDVFRYGGLGHVTHIGKNEDVYMKISMKT